MIATPPLGYLEFLGLEERARFVLADSGGIQEETTVLGVPCLTLRASTERPVTVTEGTNHLLPPTTGDLVAAVRARLAAPRGSGVVPERWDGKAAVRIAEVLCGGAG